MYSGPPGARQLWPSASRQRVKVLYVRAASQTHEPPTDQKTMEMPPFFSVDGYGLCCDFTEKCSVGAIRQRDRPVRECIYSYGQCTAGVEYFQPND